MKIRYRIWHIRSHFETKRLINRLNKNLRKAITEEQYKKIMEGENGK